jgi:hypothetical protein
MNPVSSRSILILYTHLLLSLRRDIIPSGLPSKILYAFQLYIMLATRLVHLVFNFIRNNIWLPVTIAERSKACTVFSRSEAGTVDSNPSQGMDVWCLCVCVFLFMYR